jgi:hypothetical protein
LIGSYIARTLPFEDSNMDAGTLVAALYAGAVISSSEVVKEATKDAYKALKGAVAKLFGERAERAIDAVEKSPNDAAAEKLKAAIPELEPQDVAALASQTAALLEAFRSDSNAGTIVTAARIKLDVDAQGHVTIERLRGAGDIDVKAKAGGNFTMSDVDMRREKLQGN